MTILIVISVIVLAGIGIVIWILMNEEKNTPVPMNFSEINNLTGEDVLNRVGLEEAPLSPLEPEPSESPFPTEKKSLNILDKIKNIVKLPKKNKAKQNSPTPEKNSTEKPSKKETLFKKILSKLPLKKSPNKEDEIPEATTFLSLKDHLKENLPEQPIEQPKSFQSEPPEPSLGTAGIIASEPKIDSSTEAPPPLTHEEEKVIEKELHQTDNLEILEEKHANLIKILEEKSQALEKSKEQLENELKNKKDFNKVKNLIEKELKDSKDNLRDLQANFTSKNSENESNQTKILQLEEKATNLEKEIVSKSEEIENLKKKNTELTQNSGKMSINDIPATPLPTNNSETKIETNETTSVEEKIDQPEPTTEIQKEKPIETKPEPTENVPPSNPEAPMNEMEVGEEEQKDEPMLVEEEPDTPPENSNPIEKNVEREAEPPPEEPQSENTDNDNTSGFLDLN